MLAHFTSLMIQASLVLALLFSAQTVSATAQTMPVPPVPLIRDARFDAKPVNIGTQLKYSAPSHMVRQADGKHVVVGTSCIVFGYPSEDSRHCPNIVLARFSPQGELDTRFGNHGIVQFSELVQTNPVLISVYPNRYSKPEYLELGLQSGNRIIMGWYDSAVNYFGLVRFNSDGSLDASFGSQGVVTQTSLFGPTHVAVQTDNRILITANASSFQLKRLTPDGGLDVQFGVNGIATVAAEAVYGTGQILIQADAKIVVIGDGFIRRFLPNGTPDAAFGLNSVADMTCFAPCKRLNFVQVKQVGVSFFVMGNWFEENSAGIEVYRGQLLQRFTLDGNKDLSFGTNGQLILNVPGSGFGFSAFQIWPDQRITVFAPSPDSPSAPWESTTFVVMARYFPTGQLDLGFGNHGTRSLTFGDAQSTVVMSDMEPDGSLMILGTSRPTYGTRAEFILAQVNADGLMNPAYGQHGVAHAPMLRNRDEAFTGKLLFQTDGKVIGLAQSVNGDLSGVSQYHLVRYNTTGTLDATFGTGGMLTLTIQGHDLQTRDFSLQVDGAILVAGRLEANAALVRYTAAGNLDSRFGAGGVVTATGSTFAHVLLRSNGQILTHSDFAIVGLNSAGRLDPSFGAQGQFTSAITVSAMQLMPDDSLVVGHQQLDDPRLTLFALGKTGQIKSGFGNNGVYTYTRPNSLLGFCSELEFIPQGDQLLIHTALYSTDPRSTGCGGRFLVRLTREGQLDTTFGYSGTFQLLQYRRSPHGVVATSQGIYALRDNPSWDCVYSDQCEITNATIFSYPVNGNLDPYTFGTWSWYSGVGRPEPTLPNGGYVDGIAAQPDGTLWVADRISSQGSIDAHITHLVPATHFAKLPVVLR